MLYHVALLGLSYIGNPLAVGPSRNGLLSCDF